MGEDCLDYDCAEEEYFELGELVGYAVVEKYLQRFFYLQELGAVGLLGIISK